MSEFLRNNPASWPVIHLGLVIGVFLAIAYWYDRYGQ